MIDRPPLGPASLDIGEYGIGLLRDAGFEDRTAEHALNVVIVYTLGFVALEVPRLADTTDPFAEAAITQLYDTPSR